MGQLVESYILSRSQSGFITNFCAFFGYDAGEMMRGGYTVVTPDSSNPYKQMYVAN